MLSARILKLRKTLDMTQSQFAQAIGMSASAVLDWEKNNKSIKESSILLIIRTFHVNPEWLRSGKGEMFMPTMNKELKDIFDCLITLPETKQIWAAEEIKRQIPELKKWLEK